MKWPTAGFDKIIQEYEDADERHKPFVYSSSDHFTLVLPDLTYAEGISDDSLPVLEFVPVENGSVHDGKILAFCYGKPRKSSEIASFLGLSDSSYFRKSVLEKLVAQGYLLKSRLSGAAVYATDKSSVTRK